MIGGAVAFSNAPVNSSGAAAAATLTERLRISPDGYVGINETTPSNRLHVKETNSNTIVGKIESSVAFSYLSLEDNSTTTGHVRVGAHGDDLVLRAGNDNYFRITSAGNIGINNTAPSDRLTVNADNYRGVTVESGTTAHRPTLSLRNTVDSRLAYIQGVGNDIAFGRANVNYSGHTEVVRISGSNVGIGLTNPDWHLDIKSTSTNAVVRLKSSGSTNGGQLQVNSDDLILRNRDAGELQLWTNDSNKLTITSTGELKIPAGIGPQITFENQHGHTGDAVISTYDDGVGTLLCLGSNFYFNSSGAETRYNTSEESAGVIVNRNGQINFNTGDTSATATTRLTINSAGQLKIPDNGQYTVGDSHDGRIYYNSSNDIFYIYNNSANGGTIIQNNSAGGGIALQPVPNENGLVCFPNSSVRLYYDASEKFRTTNTGAKVTGALEVTQEYPSIRPTLDLNFAATKTLDRRITFTRDSVGTYVDENGLVKYASNNVPRFDHDPTTGESLGLLIEESRTNYVDNSNDVSYWDRIINNATVESNTTDTLEVGPDGTNTSTKITGGTNSGISRDTYTSQCSASTNT